MTPSIEFHLADLKNSGAFLIAQNRPTAEIHLQNLAQTHPHTVERYKDYLLAKGDGQELTKL